MNKTEFHFLQNTNFPRPKLKIKDVVVVLHDVFMRIKISSNFSTSINPPPKNKPDHFLQ